MKIKRMVNGVEMEFELTEHELFDAHRAQEHIWDVNYIEGMFGADERFDDMDEDEKKEALDDIAWDYRERLNDAEVKDEFEIASEAFEKYFEERVVQKGKAEVNKLENVIGYGGAKEILDGFQFSGDWEMDAIRLTNTLQKHYYDDVGIYNEGIREAIDRKVSEVLIGKYPDKNFVVNPDGVLCEVYQENSGRYEIEVTIDVVGGNGETLGFKMAGNDLEEMQANILPAVQKACAEQGYLDNQIVVGMTVLENGEWLDSDEETYDLSELNVWICVYVDALGYNIDDSGPKDNLTNIIVPKAWLLDRLMDEGQIENAGEFEDWYAEYTADSTDRLARDAVSEGMVLSCCDKGISCVLGLGESFLNTNDYGKRLAEHMREVYKNEYAKGDYTFWGTHIIGMDSVKTVEDAAGWCLITYGDRALQEIQEWIGDKESNVFGFDIGDVRDVLDRCMMPVKDNSFEARLADAMEKSEKQVDAKETINLDEYEYVSNVDGYSTFRKIVKDEEGNPRGIWAASKGDGAPFSITYEQARGFEPIEDSSIKRLARQLGEMLLP